MKIIVADDSLEDRYLLKVLFESHGHTVVTVENGLVALEEARASTPDVVISDILMPVMDGYALLWQLRQEPALNKVPLLFYTGTFTEEDDRELALKLGVSRFLLKPLELDRIVGEVEAVYQEHLLGTGAELHQVSVSALEYYQTYSGRLLSKLGDKLDQLEQANALLRERNEDIRRKAEENSRLLAEAHTALKVRDRFLAVAAHELRTPLTLLKGWMQMAERAIAGSRAAGGKALDVEKAGQQLAKGLVQADRMARLVEDMSDTTEAIEGRLVLELKPLNLLELVQRVISEERLAFGEGRINFTVTPEKDGSDSSTEKWQMVADGSKLARAIASVIDNALKFSPSEEAVRLELEADIINSQAVIRVSDNGPGIAEKDQNRIFEPYYQGEPDWQNRQFGGLGVGLFVAKAIVTAHQGKLELVATTSPAGNTAPASSDARRTTFKLTLPVEGAVRK